MSDTRRKCCCDVAGPTVLCRGASTWRDCTDTHTRPTTWQVVDFTTVSERSLISREQFFDGQNYTCRVVEQVSETLTATGIAWAVFDREPGGGWLPVDWQDQLGLGSYMFTGTGRSWSLAAGLRVTAGVSWNEDVPEPTPWPQVGEVPRITDVWGDGLDAALGLPLDLTPAAGGTACTNTCGDGPPPPPGTGCTIVERSGGTSSQVYRLEVWSNEGSADFACWSEDRRRSTTAISVRHRVPWVPIGWLGPDIDCGEPLPEAATLPPLTDPTIESFMARDPMRRCRGCGG